MSKKNKELLKKVAVSSALVGTLGTTGGNLTTSIIAKASIDEKGNNPTIVEEVSNEKFEAQLDFIEQFVEKKEDGTIGLISGLSEQLKEKYNLTALEEHFEFINQGVESGIWIVNDDLSISGQISLFGGLSYSKYYWWGVRHYKSYDDAKAWASDLKNLGSASKILQVLGLAGKVTGKITSTYGKWLATDINRVNESNNQKGVIIDINWACIYSVVSQ